MVHSLRNQISARALKHVALRALQIVLVCVGFAVTASAQQLPPVHFLNAGNMPPGAIGNGQLMRGGPLPGYFQPVEIKAPGGASISLAVRNQFADPQPAPLKAGMLIGSVYRFRVTGIPQNPGAEVYPSIEVIDRIYPPGGMEKRFAIPIELTAEELDFALHGKFITRVIYLENPGTALPVVEDPQRQTYFEARPKDNPLEVADRLGRPVAILRMGGRVPTDTAAPDEHFMYGSPPFLQFADRPKAEVLSDVVVPSTASVGMNREGVR